MATIDIPEKVLQPIINQHIADAIAQAFGDKFGIVDKLVKQVLSSKVDDRGQPVASCYQDDKRYKTTLEHMAHEAIKAAALDAMKEGLAQHREAVKEAVVRELTRSGSKAVKALAESMVSGLTSTLNGSHYRIKISYEGHES